MSSVKALPIGHVTSPMYVVMDSSHGLKKSVHWPPHEGNAQYKRPPHQPLAQGGGHPSPPLAGTRGYPYPQDPSARCSAPTTYVSNAVVAASSPHLTHHGGAAAVYASANHMYRDSHFQVDTRQPPDGHHIDRYMEQQHVQHVRRRLSLRPTPDYLADIERERYMESVRLQYEREVAMGGSFSSASMNARSLKPPVVSVHTPSEMDVGQPNKRPRLAVEPKPPVHQPLLIDTRNVVQIKKEPAYTPQVEAISPTLPSEEGRTDAPMRILKENILNNINRLDNEINQVESQVMKLKKKMHDLEEEASKPSEAKETVKDVCPVESKQISIAQIIYSENRAKAQESHTVLEKLGPKVEIPMYNQPSDTAVYHENKRKFLLFKNRLVKCFGKRHRERELRENHLTETYSKLMQEWLKKMEKKENNAAKKAKDLKLREFFEKQFPELKKQREDKERISRVSQRIRSDAEWEEIIDGLQEQELEEKKMRSYAVIPPILLDSRQRKLWYINRNGLVEDLSKEYKGKRNLNIWTDQEKETFREKYLQHPKNFAFIASCLERKSVADCVQYYYHSKKTESYKQLIKKHNVRKRTRALVKPQPTQPQSSHSTGVTTRQQEDAKASAMSSSNAPNLESGPQVNSDAAATSSASSTNAVDCSAMQTPNAEGSSGENKESAKTLMPNNLRKKKEASQKAEGKDDPPSDSDTASENHNEHSTSQQPCAICKLELDNFNQSRALTKANCGMFGIKESELTEDMRVCSSCRFKSVRRRCPIPTCKTPKRKVKRLRPLPTKLAELAKEAKDAIVAELQIPPDVNKCCSACFNRITRKLETNPSGDGEQSENSRWTEDEMKIAKKGIRQHGTDWESIATLVVTKNKEQCRNFYFNYKRKFGLEEILQEYKKSKGDNDTSQQDEKPPPMVTDEEESGETTSSCDEDDRADRCSSDTASAPSPADKIIPEDKSENLRSSESLAEPAIPATSQNSEETRTRTLPHLDTSPKCPPDYDSSATVSADEGQNQIDGETRDSSPRVVNALHQQSLKMANEHPRKAFQSPMPLSKEAERSSETSIPIVKTLLQDPKIGAASTDCSSSSYIQAASKSGKDEPTCVRDLIYQAIEMSLQWPAKPGRNSSPIPTPITIGLNKDTEVTVDNKETVDAPLPAHGGSRHPSRPSSHHMEPPADFEVQDLSKKVKSRDVSPVRDYVKRERVATPARPPSDSSNSSSHIHYYGAPPPAHCNQYRSSQPPPPALSPHFVAEPHHEPYFPRTGDHRSKTYVSSDRPHSQPPHLVAQSPASLTPSPSAQAKPIPIKATVPPPPPLVASKPSQMSPKMPYKDRLISVPPSGSITQGTPVSQQPIPVPPTTIPSARYEGYLRQLPQPPQSKDVGSITLGTPVQHEAVKRVPSNRPEAYVQNMPEGLIRQGVPAMYDPNLVEYYRPVAPGVQPFSYVTGYPGCVPPQRPPYANESQLSSNNQIVIDFNTSKQMQSRRGIGPLEKEIKVSPRSSDSSSAQIVAQDTHLHPMYPPAKYQGNVGPHYSNHVPPGYQPVPDSRYIHHRSPGGQMDRTRSPSGTESPLSSGYTSHPGKRSPSLNLGSGRQNVIHRSITWGTGKPSVIQAPQSASPRNSDSRSDTVSPANVRKSTPSPRHPQPLIYPSVPPSGHDAFNTLVNAAVAQPSLAVPKDGKGSPNNHARHDVKSPRDRPVVEGLEKTLIDMHQRPRSYTDPRQEHNSAPHDRLRGNEQPSTEHQMQFMNESHRYVNSLHSGFEHHRQAEKQQMCEQPPSLRLANMREPFSREQFERQMRQTSVALPRDRSYSKKDEERRRAGSAESQQTQNYSGPAPQSDLDNEASKIFSQSFQKDAPRTNTSPRGFTAANLIDAIITRQINQNVEASNANKNPMDLFNQYDDQRYDEKSQKPSGPKAGLRTEVVTIDDEPESEKTTQSWPEKPNVHGRSPPVPPNSMVGPVPTMPYTPDKVFTLSDHIAAIISKDYNSPSDTSQSQPHYSNSQSPAGTSVSSSNRNTPYPVGQPNVSHSPIGKSMENIASASPTDVALANQNIPQGAPDHSSQNCPGNGCSYHTHSWKLRRALQQDRDREHRSPGLNDREHKRPSSNQSSDATASQEERQIIRVAQTASPSQVSTRSSPIGPYGVEPISPPSQSSENPDNRVPTSSHNTVSSLTANQAPVWASNPSITGLLTTRHLYPQDYPEGIPSSISHYPIAAVPGSNPPGGSNRPPHQQQMGLSPLDYVKNRIVEVMRTATDDEPDASEARRPHSAASHSDERENQMQQQMYRFQTGSEREASSERPCSTGNGLPQLQGQRYSPAISRYSPVPPRPSSAVERVPSRNSTPGEISRQHKRSSEGHIVTGDWRDRENMSSRASSRSASPIGLEHPDASNRKKTRSDGTFIPESTTERAPVLLPQNSINVHRSGSHSEAPRLSSSNQSAQVLDGQSASKGIVSPRSEQYHQSAQQESDCYNKYRLGDSRCENQWSLVNNHSRTPDAEPLGRLSEPVGAPSSTTPEAFSPSSRNDLAPSKNSERSDSATRHSPVTSTGGGLQESSQSSPSASSQGQRSATSTPHGGSASSSSGHYSLFGVPNGSVSSSTSTIFSSATSLPPPVSPHVAYSSFSGMGTTYAYPYSALTMRSFAASATTPVTNSATPVTISPLPVSTPARNSPSPLSRSNQPPSLLSSQYEPLSDED